MSGVIPQFYVAVLSLSFWRNIEIFATATPPNIVFILADDLGYRDVGYHGSTAIKTPTIDRLAYSGVRLENYYVQPICTPSRSTLLSGRYPIHVGLQHNSIDPCQPYSLPIQFPTVADALHNAGYATHMVGKWHIGHYAEELVPTRRGFDSFFGYLNLQEDYFFHRYCLSLDRTILNSMQYQKLLKLNKVNVIKSLYDKNWCGFDLSPRNEELAMNSSGHYSTHLYTQKAIDVISTHASQQDIKPFFLYVAYQAPHRPVQVPESYTKQYEFIKDENRRIYAGMMTCMDEGVLNITTALEKYDLWNNTILIFSTDNGGSTKNSGNNWPLRGQKKTLWEGGIKAVGFVHSPLLKKRGTVNSGLIHISDWFPTVIALAGGNTTGLNLDGYDVWKSITDGDPSPRKQILHNIDSLSPKHGFLWNISDFDNRVQSAVRVGNWKLITGQPGDPDNEMSNSWIAPPEDTNIHTVYATDPEWKNIWLFDIDSDPLEKTDLFESHQDIAVDLLKRLAEYDATAVPPRDPLNDLRCRPELHNGFFSPWRQLTENHQAKAPP